MKRGEDRELYAAIARQMKKNREQPKKPPAPTPDSPATNIGSIAVWGLSAAIGAAFIIGAAIAERPATILPLALFLGLAAFGGWILFRESVLRDRGQLLSLDRTWVRWAACVGLTVAAILGGVGTLRLFTAFFR